MSRGLALVKVALGGLWCQLSGQGTPFQSSDEARVRFEQEYDAILAEMVVALEPVSATRRTAARGR